MRMISDVPQLACLLIVLVSVTTDMTQRRIPNWLTLPGLASALIYHGVMNTWAGGGMAAAGGCLVGCALLLLPFATGGMGGGDVKLLGALGAWLGAWNILNVFIYGAFVGGVWAALTMLRAKSFSTSLGRLWRGVLFFAATGDKYEDAEKPLEIPYALAIAAGYLIFLSYGNLV